MIGSSPVPTGRYSCTERRGPRPAEFGDQGAAFHQFGLERGPHLPAVQDGAQPGDGGELLGGDGAPHADRGERGEPGGRRRVRISVIASFPGAAGVGVPDPGHPVGAEAFQQGPVQPGRLRPVAPQAVPVRVEPARGGDVRVGAGGRLVGERDRGVVDAVLSGRRSAAFTRHRPRPAPASGSSPAGWFWAAAKVSIRSSKKATRTGTDANTQADALRVGLAGYISRILILPMQDEQEARAACGLARLEPTFDRIRRITAKARTGNAPNWDSMRALRDPGTGETLRGGVAIYCDLAGRAVPTEITIPTMFLALASTNPGDIDRRVRKAAAVG